MAEGFAFAHILRKVIPIMFDLCAITETALAGANLLDNGIQESVNSLGTRPEQMDMLNEVVGRLSGLPHLGFLNERSERVIDVGLEGHALVVASTFPLTTLAAPYSISFEIDPVSRGEMYQLPYWIRGVE